ncbi:hypothetical protein DFJ58DRAFT_478901 [Suillus subalutaceus]|uniref:uncharacterized protein n=1 Tax=Suillus subalutaceus TaxID=48586 RepID=UPI001B877157|nr:uncharacterized protein DFJ58DRAFT_478901 [Suillus subalutaceus]KAG1847635.1 hypothetical protein DFJ58DRAFT_478901 [Suillus subalutaceus]
MALRLDHANSVSKLLTVVDQVTRYLPSSVLCLAIAGEEACLLWRRLKCLIVLLRCGSPQICRRPAGCYRLEVPILFRPDTDFQSMDGSNFAPELWLEMPLTPERCGPFHCIVARKRGTHVYCLTNRICRSLYRACKRFLNIPLSYILLSSQ